MYFDYAAANDDDDDDDDDYDAAYDDDDDDDDDNSCSVHTMTVLLHSVSANSPQFVKE